MCLDGKYSKKEEEEVTFMHMIGVSEIKTSSLSTEPCSSKSLPLPTITTVFLHDLGWELSTLDTELEGWAGTFPSALLISTERVF